jgi:hypothetical protein
MDAMTYGISVSGSNGAIIIHDSSFTGCTDVADNPGNIYGNRSIATAADAGLTIAVTKS